MSIWTSTKDVFVQSNTSIPFLYRLIREDKIDITLTADVTSADTVINVSAGHGFSAEDSMVLWCSLGYYQQVTVKSVSTNAITIYTPIALPFLTTNTFIVRGTYGFNVDGSSTEQIFKFHPRYIVPIDVSSVQIFLRHDGEGNLATFGDLADTVVLNGCLFQKRNTITIPYGYYRTAGDFIKLGSNPIFTDKASGSKYGTIIQIPVNSTQTFDAVSRFYSSRNDILEWIVRDNLTSGGTLEEAQISITGSYTIGE